MWGLFTSEKERQQAQLKAEHSQSNASIKADYQLTEIKHLLLESAGNTGQREQQIVNMLNSIDQLLKLATAAKQTCTHTLSLCDHVVTFEMKKGKLTGIKTDKIS
tara:strand:+ start:16346 stop:16660 length:315 start_codon:yes stop_codon:yes gene_type:complete